MNHDQASQFVHALFHQVWEHRDKSRIPVFYSERLTGFSGLTPISIKSIYESVDYIQKNIAENHYSIHDLLVDGDRISIVANGKFLTADRETEYYNTMAYFFELSKGKIIKMRVFVTQGERIQVVADDESVLKKMAEKVTSRFKPKARPKPRPRKYVQPMAEKTEKVQAQSESPATKKPEPPAKAEAKQAAQQSTPSQPSSSTTYDLSPNAKVTFGKSTLQVGVNPRAPKDKS